MDKSPPTSNNSSPQMSSSGTMPRSASSPHPPSHDDALDALDDVIAQTSDIKFVESNVYDTSPPAPTSPSNNPRQLDMSPELASFLQGIDSSSSSITRSPSRSAVSPHPEAQTHTPTARQPSPRGPRDYASPEPQQGYTVTPTARQPSPRGSQVYAATPVVSPIQNYNTPSPNVRQQQYITPPSTANSGHRSVRGSQQYTSPPNAAAVKQAELQKIQQHRQHLLRQLNQLQNIENQLTAPVDYYEEDSSIDEGYQPGASYEQLMNSLPPPSSSIATRKLADPTDYDLEHEPSFASPPPLDAEQDVHNAWESKSMSLRPSQRAPVQRERFATVSSGVRPPTGYTGLVLNSETHDEFFHTPSASQLTASTGSNTFVASRAQPEPTNLITVASESAVNIRNPARKSSLMTTTTPAPQAQSNAMKRASTYGMARIDPDKDSYQMRREVRKPTAGLSKLLLTIHLVDGSNKLVVATEDFRVQDLLYAFAEQLDLKQTDFFYLSVVYDKNPDVYRWLNPQNTLRDEGVQGNSYVIMKIKYFKLPKKLFDPVAVHLYYLQVNHYIVSGDYTAPQSLLMKLAAIQFAMTYGTHKPSIHKPGFIDAEAMSKYLPKSLMDSSPIYNLYVRLFGMHAKTAVSSPLESKLIYLDTASNINNFGMTPFEVSDSIKDPNRAQRVFGVAEDGLFLSTKNSKEQLEFYSYDDVMSWAVKLRGFEIVVRDPANPEQCLNIELEPKHPELTHTIINLINGYCLFLVFVDEEKYNHLPVVNDEPLPHPSMFHPPKPRNLQLAPPSRLSLLRAFYVEKCKETKHPEIQPFLLQIDKALDFGETLQTLSIRKCGLNDTQIFHFSRLVAKSFTLKPEGVEVVENFNLTSLDISHNTIGPEAAEAVKIFLEAAPTIKILKMRNVGLAERGTQLLIPVLEKHLTLEVFDVSGNILTDTGIIAILKALKPNKVLREFDSELNLLTDKVALLFSQMVAETPTLTTLSLAKNKLGSKGLKTLLEGLTSNRTIENLNLSSNAIGNKQIKTLFDWLQGNQTVKRLYLADNKLNQQTGTELAKILSLKGLTIQVVDITLNELGTKGTKEIIKAIKVSPTLSEIHLSGNKISDKGAKLLCESLELNHSITKLAIRLCSIGKGALKSILRVVTPHRQIKFLDIALNEVTHGVAVVLGAMLAQNTTLEVLHLSNCSLSNTREITPIIDALPRNTKLKKLYLDVNKFGKANLLALAQAICANESLESLSMKNIDTTPKEIDDFLKALVKAKALQTLNLKLNGLQESYFANTLKRLPMRVKF